MREIKIGDRVEVDASCAYFHVRGKRGMVKGFAGNSILVEFDEDIGGHDGGDGGLDCGVKAKDGHGWYVSKSDLTVIQPASRFKVGDRVRVRRYKDIPDGVPFGFISDMEVHCGETVTISCVEWSESRECYRYELERDTWSWHEDMFEAEPVREEAEQKIVITTDGKTTVAKLYAGDEVVREGKADCSPDDKFDFATGAKLALDRLTREEKPFKFEVGKQYCDGVNLVIEITDAKHLSYGNRYCYTNIKGSFGVSPEFDEDSLFADILKPYEPQYYNGKVVCIKGDEDFTAGKIYEFVDGQVTDNDGTPRPIGERIEALDEYTACNRYEFIPLVE